MEEEQLNLKIILSNYQFHLKFMLIFECNFKNVEIHEGSYTKKYHDHIPCSYAYKIVCIDDRFSKSILIYRGENAAYEFTRAILKEYKYCKKIMKKILIKI